MQDRRAIVRSLRLSLIARRLAPALYAIPAWVVLLATPRLPFTDLPEHVATTRVLRDLIAGEAVTSGIYEPNVLHSQYWLHHLAVALLAFVAGPVGANTIVLLIAAAAYPLSLSALLRAHGRDERLAVFGAMPFLSRPLAVGFLPFVTAVPAVLFGLASLRRYLAAPSRPRAAALAATAVALFYLHVDAFAVFALAAFLDVAIASFDRARLVDSARAIAARLAFFGPAILVAAHWFLRGSLAAKAETFRVFVGRMSAPRTALAIPLWMGDLWADGVDDAACTLWWAAVLILVVVGIGEFRATAARPLLSRYAPLTAAIVLLFALPYRIGAAAMLNVRIATFVALFAVVLVPAPRARLGWAALAAAAIATLVQAGDAVRNIRRLAGGSGADAAALVAQVPRGAKLLTLVFDPAPEGAIFPPWLHAGAWHVAEGGAVEGPSFIDLPHWSVRYRDGRGPPDRPLFWHACVFRNAVEGRYYDRVLVVGGVDPFAAKPPGPAFRRVDRRGVFTLYERIDAAAWDGDAEADPGPCAAPTP